MDDDLAYLAPGFDLSSLTVPRIRSILVSHDVPYPASAKKPQLINIMETEVLPKAKKLLNARARTKPTSRGIIDVPSSQESTIDDSEEEKEPMPPPPPRTPGRGRRKKTTDILPTTEADDAPAPVRKTPGRKSVAKHPRASDTETDNAQESSVRPSARKTRKSQTNSVPREQETPRVRISEPHLPVKKENAGTDSVFTDDNPFQSGSSPSSRDRRRSADRKKRLSQANQDDKRKSSSRKRETISPVPQKQDDDVKVPSRSTFEFPISRVTKKTSPPREDTDPQLTEEFTPEEQLEVVRERAAQGYSGRDMIPARRTRPKSKAGKTAKSALWLTVFTLFSSFSLWYRKEKIEIGYCGVGKANWALTETAQLPTWANDLQPQCEPCPQHAYCYEDFVARCQKDFVLKDHPLSLGGLIPLPPTCEPDSEKLRRMTSVANRAIEELRDRKAQAECKEPGPDGTIPETVEIGEQELKEVVSKKRRKGMSDQEFDDLFQGALGEIMNKDEILSSRDGIGRLRLSSSSLARASYTCILRRRLRQQILEHRISVLILTLAIASGAYGRSSLIRRRRTKARVPELVELALDRLATQAAIATERGGNEWLSIGQLRDDVLRTEFERKDREMIWDRVRKIVEGNSNVRVNNREDERTGEYLRTWEWIGPVGTPARRLAVATAAAAGNGGDAIGDIGERRKDGMVRESRKWDEGRPIY